MKIICLLLALLTAGASMAQIALPGRVVLQNSGNQSLQGAEVSAPLWASPKTSDSQGRFLLKIESKKPGDQITLNVRKPGYEIVNLKEMSRLLPADGSDSVKIVMCVEGQREKSMMAYYQINKKSIHQKYESKLAQLRKEGKDKSEAMEKLIQERETALAHSRELAKKFAEVNLDDASELYREAFGYYTRGNTENAINLLNKANLHQKDVQTTLLQADLYITRMQFDSARLYYELAAHTEPDNYNSVLPLATFLWYQRQNKEAHYWFDKLELLTEKNIDKAELFNRRGYLYNTEYELQKAIDVHSHALAIYQKLEEENPGLYGENIVDVYNNLAKVWLAKGDQAQSKACYERALQILQQPQLQSRAFCQPMLASLYLNMAILYDHNHEYFTAGDYINRSMTVYEALFRKDSSQYLPFLAGCEFQFAKTLMEQGEMEQAEARFLKARQLTEELSRQNPELYLTFTALVDYETGQFYLKIQDYPKAEKYLQKAQAIYEQFADNQIKLYQLQLAWLYEKLGALYQKQFETEKAWQYLDKAQKLHHDNKRWIAALLLWLDMRNNLANSKERMLLAQQKVVFFEEKICEPGCSREQEDALAFDYSTLSRMLLLSARAAEAEIYAQKAVKLNPEQQEYQARLALSYLYSDKYEQARDISRAARKNPEQFEHYRQALLEALDELERVESAHPDAKKLRQLLSR